MGDEEREFQRQIEAALKQELHGWDWSWLDERTREAPLPWDYRAIARERIRGVDSLLDIGTGGGEFLAGIFEPPGAPAVPPLAWATEGYPPNVVIARARLAPLGIQVLDVSGITDHNTGFDDGTFALIIDRHMGIPGRELARVLKPGGYFITQQVGGENCIAMNQALGAPDPTYRSFTLDYHVRDLQAAGLRVIEAREAMPEWTFLDLAGLVFYLQTVSWQVPDFTVAKYRAKLYNIYKSIKKEGGFIVRTHRILVAAQKAV